MYNPYSPKTILKIQTAQRSVTLPLVDHLRASLECVRTEIMSNGRFVSDETLAKWQARRDDIKEQIRILENITSKVHEAYMKEVIKSQ